MDSLFLGLSPHQWLDLGTSALIILAAALLGRWFIAIILGQVARRMVRRTNTMIDDAILDTIRPPLYGLILVVAIQAAVTRLDFFPSEWEDYSNDFFFILYLLVGFIFVWKFVDNFFAWYSKEVSTKTETKLDEQLMPFFRRIALVVVSAIGIITVFSHFGVEISALVTTLGIGSLAFALAAQATLSDTLSGFVIMIDRPFRIGDRIEIQDLDTWGDVVDIGLRSSRIRTRDNRMVIVPNSVISKSLIVNHSYPDTQYRIEVHIGVGYGTDIEVARQTMIEAVRNVEGVLPERPVEALFLEFGDFALIFRVRWWIESYVDTRRMFDRVNTALYHALKSRGIKIPYPQQDIRLIHQPDN